MDLDFGVSQPLTECNQSMKDILVQGVMLGLEIKRKKQQEQDTFCTAVKSIQHELESVSGHDDESIKEELKLLSMRKSSLDQELGQLMATEDDLKQQVKKSHENVEDTIRQRQECMKTSDSSSKAYINLYRDVTKISWSSRHDVTGFTCHKSSSKAFHFNQETQSDFFITNRLWAMGNQPQ